MGITFSEEDVKESLEEVGIKLVPQSEGCDSKMENGTMSIINLEKCPKCGSNATLHIINPLYDDLYFVCCNKCDESTTDYDTMEGAIVAWNDNASYHKRDKEG